MLSATVASVHDLEAHAGAVLPKMVYDFYRTGSDGEVTLHETMSAFKKYKLRPRVMVDVSQIDTSTSLMNGKIPLAIPICIAPTSRQMMAHHDGEIAMTKAAAKAGSLMCLSSFSTVSLERVSAAADSSPKWFQLYVYRNRKVTENLVRRAERAGYEAIVVTVDSPYIGKREVDIRNNFAIPKHLKLGNFLVESDLKFEDEVALEKYLMEQIDPSLQWKDIAWIASISKLPIVVKGVQTKEDALLAIENGSKGIWISNHGARQLDTVPPTIDVLEEIARVTSPMGVDVYVDGGFRRGTDVFKALALGARAVFIGRPPLWGLTYKGQEGVELTLKIIRDELRLAMAFCGVTKISQISKSYLITPGCPLCSARL
eukprot:TRINITY_DN23580_c0_g1_i1.p1 TRINITY_DN23580_c0_g1~~TRINITY_DN23580_c0_g1_i1.p1  ORF type:complete len:372 (-),score=101.00 TRINITY_DN23580_c0_g1_i1:156-1271(-)